MGVKGSAAIRARQREVAARVDRLIARGDKRARVGSPRRAEIRVAVRAGRVALRRRARVVADLADANAEVGAALHRIVAAGVKHAEAFEALGVSVGVGRRLLHQAKQPREPRTSMSSTASPTERVDPVPSTKPGPNATCAGTPKGID